MNILYLHGLGSTGLTDDKRAVVMSVLKPEVLIAPVFDYTEEGVEKKIEDLFHAHSFDLIIGSSTGAMVAHTLSCRSNINAILINPAFKHNVVDRLLPKFIRSTEVGRHTFFVFGTEDLTVPMQGTLDFFNVPNTPIDRTLIVEGMEHRFWPSQLEFILKSSTLNSFIDNID